ncbi:MerR family DNA-binding transcriptional regulator [Fusobacterium nucleatum]
MKELYSIGEVSEIMGVSVQTLRYYSNINLILPKYVNPSNRVSLLFCRSISFY